MQALDAKYRTLYEPLYAQRKAVVLGADGGIPGFWGTVIEHHHLMQEEITEKDQGVLRHLQEVAWEPLVEEGKEGFKLKFFFTFFFMTLTVTFFPFFQAISVPTASSSTSSSSAFMT